MSKPVLIVCLGCHAHSILDLAGRGHSSVLGRVNAERIHGRTKEGVCELSPFRGTRKPKIVAELKQTSFPFASRPECALDQYFRCGASSSSDSRCRRVGLVRHLGSPRRVTKPTPGRTTYAEPMSRGGGTDG